MKQIPLAVQNREGVGSTRARALRRQGLIPAVLYGHKTESRPLAVSEREFLRVMKAVGDGHVLFALTVEGGSPEPVLAILKEVQHDKVKPRVLHVDFQAIQKDEEIRVHVPIHFLGSGVCPGVKEGGVFESLLRSLDVSCLPDRIPESIEVDVSAMAINDSLHVSDLKVPEGVRVLVPLNTVVALVAPPSKEEEAAPATAAPGAEAPAEPEVLTARKKEEPAAEGEGKEKGGGVGKASEKK